MRQLNDRMLGDMGLLPALAAVGVPLVGKIIGGISFGATPEFQRRQQYRDQIANMINGYKAALPELPAYIRPTVAADIEEMGRRTWREGMRESDYIANLTWFGERVKAWDRIPAPTAPTTGVTVTAPVGLKKPGAPAPYEVVSPGTQSEGYYDPSGAFHYGRPPTAPAYKEAGLPSWLPIVLIGGLLFTMKK